MKRSQHLAGEDAWKTQEPTSPQDTEKKKGSIGSLSNASQRSSDYRPIIARASERGASGSARLEEIPHTFAALCDRSGLHDDFQ